MVDKKSKKGKKKSVDKQLEKKIFLKKQSTWLDFNESDKKKIFALSEDYKKFIGSCKTERLAVDKMISLLVKNGYKDFDKAKSLKKFDKVYRNIKGKAIIACVVGSDVSEFRIIGSHVDSPRLDLKPNPLYQDAELALFQSHYYGGIKKYHWVNTPLALHGVVHIKNGKKVTISIGENEDDPKFIIPDLLPHLATDQMKKPANKIIEGEELNIIIGHIPVKDKTIDEKIKFAVLKYLYNKYQIIEEDFLCAELEFVPAGKPVDIGFDKGLVGAYGQDDKVCAFTSLMALLKVKKPKHTAVGFFIDKEEIGSYGNTGAQSFCLLNFAIQYRELLGIKKRPMHLLESSKSLSADVTAAMDPTFASVNDPHNVSYLGRGISVEKYGGGGGKYSTNDASSEYMQYLRQMMDKNKIKWQTGELGKIDIGGGGTIAMFMSRYGMECTDAGPCILGMHSPCEVTSKADIYSSYLMYKVFFND